uniref:C2H2-type domain-containing protein n=1 Tax=Caenorhabditis tropicalis TaxID=1561998 RepID=A0A1I7U8L4_9PELO
MPAVLCALCPAVFGNKADRLQHSKNDHEAPFKCAYCSKILGSKSSLRKHVTNHRVGPQKCLICNKVLAFRTNMARHYARIHLKKKKKKSSDNGVSLLTTVFENLMGPIGSHVNKIEVNQNEECFDFKRLGDTHHLEVKRPSASLPEPSQSSSQETSPSSPSSLIPPVDLSSLLHCFIGKSGNGL